METRTARIEENVGRLATHQLSQPNASAVRQDPTLLREGTKQERKERLEQANEGFLAAPVPVVLAGLWLAGFALISVCGVALYLLWVSLQMLVAGG